MPIAEGHEMAGEALGLPDSRLTSGTSWMPDSTPMYGFMQHSGDWGLMFHGAAHLAYLQMNGPRGDDALDSMNWAMVMARRQTSQRGRVLLKGMFSLDPLTVGGGGYPLLFQTGETWNGVPLMDHQHPHNYISELAGRYSHEFGEDSAGYAYVGIVGEPALGPPTFMHRTQALDNPLAPIGHHWQDATHIAYGVITLGYQTRRWQLEASVFNGREPGENRWEIQSPRLDSASARLSCNPSPGWALQVSHGYLHSPEALHPGEDVWRTTASAIYNRRLSERGNFQAAFVWGRNRIAGQDMGSFLLEGQWKHDGGWTPYVRYEHVEKNAEELVVPFPPSRVFNVQQLTLGVSRDICRRGDYQWAVGVQALLNFVPGDLKPVYGDDPMGWVVYVRVHPRKMQH
ncbi:MAG: hypothetical protein KKI08_24000 [Armatimonadetes bacterium]|nr:hypothetical protein [Armatimonadota bacterium]